MLFSINSIISKTLFIGSMIYLIIILQFQTLVLEVDPAEYQVSTSSAKLGHKWKVTFAPVTDRSNLVTEEYDAVVVCNGLVVF